MSCFLFSGLETQLTKETEETEEKTGKNYFIYSLYYKLGSQAIICFLLRTAYWSWSRIRPTVIVLCQDPWLLVAGHTLGSVLSPLVLSVGDVDGGRLLSVAWDRAPAHIVVDHSLAWSFQPVIKEHKDKDKNSRTQESCPIMLVDVDPGQVLPGLALPHNSSTAAGSCFWPRQEDWWLGPVRWHQSSRAHHARSQNLSLLALGSSFQVNTEHTVVGIASERLCGDYLLQDEGLRQLPRHPSRCQLKTQRLAKHQETRNRARQQRAKIEPQKKW